MTLICFGFIGTTTVTAVTDTAADAYAADTHAGTMKRFRLLVSSDRNIHIDRNADADPSSSARLPVGQVAEVFLFGGDRLSVIRATGETDGSVWVTVTD